MYSFQNVENQQSLAEVLIKAFMANVPIEQAIHQHEIQYFLNDGLTDAARCNQIFSQVKLDDIPAEEGTTPGTKLAKYLQFQRYVIELLAGNYLKDGGKPTPSYNLERQRRVTLPDAEAYELMGFNNLNVNEDKQGYAFIYK